MPKKRREKWMKVYRVDPNTGKVVDYEVDHDSFKISICNAKGIIDSLEKNKLFK